MLTHGTGPRLEDCYSGARDSCDFALSHQRAVVATAPKPAPRQHFLTSLPPDLLSLLLTLLDRWLSPEETHHQRPGWYTRRRCIDHTGASLVSSVWVILTNFASTGAKLIAVVRLPPRPSAT